MATTTASYPPNLKNLLISIDLIGAGKFVLRCDQLYLNFVTNDDLDNEGNPIIQKRVFDTNLGVLQLYFSKRQDGFYINDWTAGLTEETIKKVEAEARVPRPREWFEDLTITEGEVLDLSIPHHKLRYNLALTSPMVAKSKELLDSNRIYYFEEIGDEEKILEVQAKEFEDAIALLQKLTNQEKHQLNTLLARDYNISDSAMAKTQSQVNATLLTYLEDKSRRSFMMKAWKDPIKMQKILLYEAMEFGVIEVSESGIVLKARDGSKLLGETIEIYAANITKDTLLKERIIGLIDMAKKSYSDVSASDIKESSSKVEYDLSYDTYADLEVWPVAPLQALLRKEGVLFSESESIPELINRLRSHNDKKTIKQPEPIAEVPKAKK